jgi:hypothetical protein
LRLRIALLLLLLSPTLSRADETASPLVPACPITQADLTKERMDTSAALINCATATRALVAKVEKLEDPPSRLMWLSLGLASGLAIGLAAGYAR